MGRFTMRPFLLFNALALAGRHGSSVREVGSGALSAPPMVTNTSFNTIMDASHANISRIRCIIFHGTCGWPPNFMASVASRGTHVAHSNLQWCAPGSLPTLRASGNHPSYGNGNTRVSVVGVSVGSFYNASFSSLQCTRPCRAIELRALLVSAR